MNNNMKIGIKEGVGVVAGVVIGRYLFKSKNILVLTALGVASGVIVHFLIKQSKKVDSLGYIDEVSEDIETSESESNFYGDNREMDFNKTLGYHTPEGEIVKQEPKDYMDINFN